MDWLLYGQIVTLMFWVAFLTGWLMQIRHRHRMEERGVQRP